MTVIVLRPTVYLDKLLDITSLNQSLETPNSHTPHTLLVYGTYQKLQLQSSQELKLGMWWNLNSHLPIVPHLLVV